MSLRMMAITVLVLLILAVGLHSFAVWQHGVARDESRPLDERVAAAQRAATIEPFDRRFEVTAVVTEAAAALSRGDIDAAYFALLPYSTTVRGDELFTRTYRAAVEAKWELDARKAHQQHAKEKKGGELAPEDVFE